MREPVSPPYLTDSVIKRVCIYKRMCEPVSGTQAVKQQNDARHLTYPHGGTPLAGQDGFLPVTCLIRCARTATNSCRQQQDRR